MEPRKLYRLEEGKMLCGVCAGLESGCDGDPAAGSSGNLVQQWHWIDFLYCGSDYYAVKTGIKA